MAHKTEIAPPEPTTCPLCGGERVVAESGQTMQLMRRGAKLPGLTGAFSQVWALVCVECGYTMLFARKPQALIQDR